MSEIHLSQFVVLMTGEMSACQHR